MVAEREIFTNITVTLVFKLKRETLDLYTNIIRHKICLLPNALDWKYRILSRYYSICTRRKKIGGVTGCPS